MGELLFPALEITNFRIFSTLPIAQLGQVNLLTGKNSVGKTSVLEALYLYAHNGHPQAALKLVQSRGEASRTLRISTIQKEEDEVRIQQALVLKYLFYGRQDLETEPQTMTIGPHPTGDQTLTVTVGWSDSDAMREYSKVKKLSSIAPPELYLITQKGYKVTTYNLKRYMERSWERAKSLPFSCVLIPANGISQKESAMFWDRITLTPLEQKLLEALQIIEPTIMGLSFVSSLDDYDARSPWVRMRGSDAPIPLRSLGEGLNRLLGIMLALLTSQGGMLLIDEIESGLHYSVQTQMWKIILHLATTLPVQVFATTHSWDCLAALQAATQENEQATSYVIRLDRKQDAIVPTLFDQRRLAIATREQIEVR